MKKGLLFFLFVIATALPIAGSHPPLAGAAAGYVPPPDRLSVTRPAYTGKWKADDLSVKYSYSRNQEQIDLSGKVRFSYSLVMGYTLLDNFNLSAVILDENGRVLEQTGLVTDLGSLDPIPFHRRFKLPPGAAYIAFSYQGTVSDSGGGDGADTTNFWHDPIH